MSLSIIEQEMIMANKAQNLYMKCYSEESDSEDSDSECYASRCPDCGTPFDITQYCHECSCDYS